MKRLLYSVFAAILFLAMTPITVQAGGFPEGYEPVVKRRPVRRAPPPEPELPPEPTCVPRSRTPEVRITSWDPNQKVSKFLGTITECVTTQWDIIKMLPGPNIINVEYPSENEQWGYSWLWRYKLQNPIGDTIIMMDNPGKRIKKGKDPVELFIVFNDDDVVEKIEMTLVKKKNSQY